MSKKAIILAGGLGTRLQPYTIVLPKPLMPVGDLPILEIVVKQLAKYNFDSITMAVNHQAEIIKAFFGDGSKWNIPIDYSMEDQPLSTMGPLKIIQDLPENFLIMNGDILTDLNYGNFFDFHVTHQNMFTISAYQRKEKIDYGVLKVDQDSYLSGFEEKPIPTYDVSMGIYMANRKILNLIPENTPYGFDHLMTDLLKSNTKVNVKFFNGYWLDIGRVDDYKKAIEIFSEQKERFLF
jgi:NDP-sugar pyrophosphorylase family protein